MLPPLLLVVRRPTDVARILLQARYPTAQLDVIGRQTRIGAFEFWLRQRPVRHAMQRRLGLDHQVSGRGRQRVGLFECRLPGWRGVSAPGQRE